MPRSREGPDYGVYGYTRLFGVRDLDGDGEPEVLLELNWNGAHCCSWSRIYRYDARRNTYIAADHFWGNLFAVQSHMRDLDGDGTPEFVASDDRFAYRFGGYADSVFPIRIWSYRHGAFYDVTRRYPKRVEQDAARFWRYYLATRSKERSTRGLLGAWAAEEELLGHSDRVDQGLADALRQGYLRNGGIDAPGAKEYVVALKSFLRKTGYIRG